VLAVISEREMEASIVRHLTRVGVPVQRQVRVRSGIIDLLTPAAMYEVKRLLTRVAMWQGLGQLLVYAREVTPTRHHRVLIGHHTGDTERLAPVFNALGVTVYACAATTPRR